MIDANESWKPIPGYEAMYEVSDHGNVRSLDRVTTGPSGAVRTRRGRMMRLNLSSANGYVMVQLCKNGRVEGKLAHRLVAMAFLDLPDEFETLQVRHYDGNKLNNHVSNLRWGTPVDNYQDMKRHGRDNWTKVRPVMEVCKRGHLMTKDNIVTYQARNRCLKCSRMRARSAQAKKRVDWLREELIKAEAELAEAKKALA